MWTSHSSHLHRIFNIPPSLLQNSKYTYTAENEEDPTGLVGFTGVKIYIAVSWVVIDTI
jgi:hypothetical protein